MVVEDTSAAADLMEVVEMEYAEAEEHSSSAVLSLQRRTEAVGGSNARCWPEAMRLAEHTDVAAVADIAAVVEEEESSTAAERVIDADAAVAVAVEAEVLDERFVVSLDGYNCHDLGKH